MVNPSAQPYNILSVCAGAGGLDLAVGLAVRNACTVGYVERDVQTAGILGARMADRTLHGAPVWSDLSTFDGCPWRGSVDCVISGDPCQPNSVAGAGLGSGDDRFLIDQLVRVIAEVRPARLFRENVAGNAAGQLAALVPALEELGYRVAAGIFSAGEVGAAHRRERLYVMADAGRGRRAGSGSGQDQQSGRAEAVGPSEVVAHTEGASAVGLSRGEAAQDPRPKFSRDHMADADGGNARPEGQQRGRQQRFQSEGDGDCGKLAHANGVGLQGIIAGRRDPQGRHKPNEFFELRGGTGHPIFAPGPTDAGWHEILAREPFLAPSLSDLDIAAASFSQGSADLGTSDAKAAAQSIFRRMVDGLAHRTDRLRAVGNGVCPVAGALAFISLSAHFSGR